MLEKIPHFDRHIDRAAVTSVRRIESREHGWWSRPSIALNAVRRYFGRPEREREWLEEFTVPARVCFMLVGSNDEIDLWFDVGGDDLAEQVELWLRRVSNRFEAVTSEEILRRAARPETAAAIRCPGEDPDAWVAETAALADRAGARRAAAAVQRQPAEESGA